jgi:hypothetical protein
MPRKQRLFEKSDHGRRQQRFDGPFQREIERVVESGCVHITGRELWHLGDVKVRDVTH